MASQYPWQKSPNSTQPGKYFTSDLRPSGRPRMLCHSGKNHFYPQALAMLATAPSQPQASGPLVPDTWPHCSPELLAPQPAASVAARPCPQGHRLQEGSHARQPRVWPAGSALLRDSSRGNGSQVILDQWQSNLSSTNTVCWLLGEAVNKTKTLLSRSTHCNMGTKKTEGTQRMDWEGQAGWRRENTAVLCSTASTCSCRILTLSNIKGGDEMSSQLY